MLWGDRILGSRVAVVTGAQCGLGLETAKALAEAGATGYCLDLPTKRDQAFVIKHTYVSKLGLAKGTLLEYVPVDQRAVWDVVKKVAERESQSDLCVAAASILREEECLEFLKLMNVSMNGILYFAQAAGRQLFNFR